MDISDVRIKLVNDSTDRLKAFCSVTLDEEFVIRDIKIVEGANGLFVAMPSRKLSAPCPKCRHKNPLRARYCSECGTTLPNQEVETDEQGRARLYRDIAHPITTAFREKLQKRVVEAYQTEREQAPDAVDYGDGDYEVDDLDELEHERGGEYDDIIADLRSGGGTPRGEASQRGPRQPQPSSGRASDDRPPRRRRGRGRGRRRHTDEERAERAPQPAAVSEARSVERDEDAESCPDANPQLDVEPPAEAHEEAEVAPTPVAANCEADQVSLGEAAEAPPAEQDSKEDTTPFGAGIS